MPLLWLVPVVELDAATGGTSKRGHQGGSHTKGSGQPGAEGASSAGGAGVAGASQQGSVSGAHPSLGVGLGGIRTLSGRSQASQSAEGPPLTPRQMAAASLLPPPPPPAGAAVSSPSSASQQILASMGPSGSYSGVITGGGGPRMSIGGSTTSMGGQGQQDKRGGLGNILAQSGPTGSLRRSMIGQVRDEGVCFSLIKGAMHGEHRT
jgi:hypothetical protein